MFRAPKNDATLGEVHLHASLLAAFVAPPFRAMVAAAFVNLEALMTLAYNRMSDRFELPGERIAESQRGDVLHDIWKRLLAIQG